MTTPVRHRHVGVLPPFDPDQGETVLAPEHSGQGYWTGCPSLLYEADTSRFLLTYRQRRPRGTPRTERGWRCAVAESSDGLHFSDIWAVEKQDFETPSMERMSLLPRDGGGYALYVSYVDPDDHRWRIDLLEADTADGFTPTKRAACLTAATTGTEGVKDPLTLRVGPALYLFASYAKSASFTEAERARAHASSDIYNVGGTTFPTGLAVSLNGREFDWKGEVLPVHPGWDSYQARLTSVIPLGGLFLGFYDGSAGVEGNFEEYCGLAVSSDLVSWDRLTPAAPWLRSPHASGSLRYVDALAMDDHWLVYYEYARADGSHELRLSRVPSLSYPSPSEGA